MGEVGVNGVPTSVEGIGGVAEVNGDAFFKCRGLIRPTATPGVFAGENIFYVTGGRGRFQGAPRSGSSRRWPNVRVQPEHVGWIIAVLQGDEAVVGRGAVGGADPRLALVAEEADEDAAIGDRLEGRPGGARPGDLIAGDRGVGPGGVDPKRPFRVSVTHGRFLGADAPHGPAELDQRYRR